MAAGFHWLIGTISRTLGRRSGKKGVRGRVYHLSRHRLGSVAGDIDKSALSGPSISINHYNDPLAYSRQGSKYRRGAPVSRCSASFGYLPRPWVTTNHYQAVISPRKVPDTPESTFTSSSSSSFRFLPLARSCSYGYEKRDISEVNDGYRTLVLEPAYLPTNQPTSRHLIPSIGSQQPVPNFDASVKHFSHESLYKANAINRPKVREFSERERERERDSKG